MVKLLYAWQTILLIFISSAQKIEINKKDPIDEINLTKAEYEGENMINNNEEEIKTPQIIQTSHDDLQDEAGQDEASDHFNYSEEACEDNSNNAATSSSGEKEMCTYTFIVPSKPNVHVTTCSNSERKTVNETFLERIHDRVLSAQLRVEEIRSELIKESEQISSLTILQLKENVRQLQEESRTSAQRIAQLYMQLLHEIINKRDCSIEIQQLQNKLLNITLLYYELKMQNQQLATDYIDLQQKAFNQSEELKILRKQIENFNKTISKCQNSSLAATGVCSQKNFSKNYNRNLPSGPFRDCSEAQQAGYRKSGLFIIKPSPGYSQKIKVWCDLAQDPGGWTVIQRRQGKKVNFKRNMAAYKKGFGKPQGSFWLGLENIHRITNQSNFKLHIELEDWDGRKRMAEYRNFRIEGEDTGYRLRITHYGGNAGDSLSWHNNMRFTTIDVDNDLDLGNCARTLGGGWWYKNCARSNLNGIYHTRGYHYSQVQNGIYWSAWRGATYSLKRVLMKVRPTE